MTKTELTQGMPIDESNAPSFDGPYLETPDPAPNAVCGVPPYSEDICGAEFSLRRLRANAFPEAYLHWLNDPDVIRFLQVRFESRDYASAKKFVASFDHVNTFIFGIYENTSDAYIGNITLRANPHHLFANMGYLIGDRRYWRTDAALDAVRLICDFAFFERGLRKIFELTTANHIASNFNFRRLGFTYEGKIPDLYWGEGAYNAATIWTMTAREWAEIRDYPVEEVTP